MKIVLFERFKKPEPPKAKFRLGGIFAGQKQKKKKKFSLKRKALSWSITTILVMVAVGMVRRGLGSLLPVGGRSPAWLEQLRGQRDKMIHRK